MTKRLIALAVSLLIMGIIFWRIDYSEFRGFLAQTDPVLFLIAVFFFVPQILVAAYRWKYMIREKITIRFRESVRLVLASNALNILIPSRVGDLSKAYFLKREGKLEIKRGMNIVIFEKYMDLASLGLVALTGILFEFEWSQANLFGLGFSTAMIAIFFVLYFVRIDRALAHPFFESHKITRKIKHFLADTQEYLLELKRNPAALVWIIAVSIFLWFVHILQFYFIFQALRSPVTLFQVFRLVPLAILVGLVPLTIAGVGTRDSAMLYFFKPYDEAARIVGVGIFASLRYFVPGILGLPFLNHYMVKPGAPAGRNQDEKPDV